MMHEVGRVKVRTRLAFLSLLATVFVGGFWWFSRPPPGTQEACRKFMELVNTGQCDRAYRLAIQSTYGFSSNEAFCDKYGDDYDRVSISCGRGEWVSGRYVFDGTLGRERRGYSYPPIGFELSLTRRTGAWLVDSLTFDEHLNSR
jgi:hypothetical protein